METAIRELTERVGKLEIRTENTEIDIQELQDSQEILQTMSNNIATLAESDKWLTRHIETVGEKVDCLIEKKKAKISKTKVIIFTAMISALCSGLIAFILTKI